MMPATPLTEAPAPEAPEPSARRRSHFGGRLARGLVAVLVAFALLAGATGFWAYRELHPSGAPGADVLVVVPTGASTSAIVDLLAREGVIGNAGVFKVWLRLKSAGPFQAGQYRLRKNQDADAVLATLRSGPLAPPDLRFVVPPGLNSRQIPAKVVEKIPTFSAAKVAAAIGSGQVRSATFPEQPNLEGLLFPDTYDLAASATELSAVQVMVQQFDKVVSSVGLANARVRVGVDPYQVVVIASLIEEEAKVDSDRAKIARVIYNRLALGMPLGVDATLCYLKDERPCVLRQSDLSAPGPYNSRLTVGLPPTPIASPGRASLEAALNPAAGDWIYYVLDPQLDPAGTRHLFTSSVAEFDAARARCRAANLGCG